MKKRFRKVISCLLAIIITLQGMVAFDSNNAYAAETKLTGEAFGNGTGGNFASNLFDDNTTNYMESDVAVGYGGIDLGEGNEQIVTKIRFYPRLNWAHRMSGGVFQGSNDDSNYVDLYTISSIKVEQWNEVNISNQTSFRYLRYISKEGGNGNVSEVEFYTGGTEGTPPTTPVLGAKLTGTAFGTDGAGGGWADYTKAFDNSFDGYFADWSGGEAYAGIDLGVGKEKAVTGIRFFPEQDLVNNMVDGIFQGSNTGVSSGYVDLYTISSAPDAGWNYISVTDTTPYRYIRFIKSSANGQLVDEIEFYTSAAAQAVSITGMAKYGHTLTANATGFSGTLSYQWKRGGNDIADANSSTYPLKQEDIGQIISVTVIPSEGGAVTSDATAAVSKADGSATPTAPTVLGQPSDNTITLNEIEGAEYAIKAIAGSIQGSFTWQDSPTFTELTSGTAYKFVSRIKETATNVASNVSANSEDISTTGQPGARVISGTPFGNGTNGNFASNLFDGNLNNFCESDVAIGHGGIDLGEGNEQAVTKIRFFPRVNYAYRMVGGVFQGSVDGTTYTDLYTISSVKLSVWNEVAINDTTHYRYLRYISQAGGNGNAAEVEFYTGGTVGQPPVMPILGTKLSGTAFGTQNPDWCGFGKAFDNSFDGYFADWSGGEAYAGIDLGAEIQKTVTGIRFIPEEELVANVVGGKFQGSNDNTTYVDLYTIDSAPDAGWNYVIINNPTPFRYIRFIKNSANGQLVDEIEFYTDGLPGTVEITGTAKYGQMLTANPSNITGILSYQWRRNGTNIEGATNSTYTTVQDDIGQTITVTITSSIGAVVTSEATATVTKAEVPSTPGAPTISGIPNAHYISLNAIPGAEYAIKAINGVEQQNLLWQDSATFTNLNPTTQYIFVTRIKETATQSGSGTSADSAPITTADVYAIANTEVLAIGGFKKTTVSISKGNAISLSDARLLIVGEQANGGQVCWVIDATSSDGDAFSTEILVTANSFTTIKVYLIDGAPNWENPFTGVKSNILTINP